MSPRSVAIRAWSALLGIGFAPACAEPAIDVHVSQQVSGDGGTSMAVRVSDRYTGDQLDVRDVEIEVANADGEWMPATLETADNEGARLDVVLVADNSSDQKALEATIQKAARDFGHEILGRGVQGRVGMVRVSTQARVVQELTESHDDVDIGVHRLFVSNGWTAFYDGVRLANEVLESSYEERESDPCATPIFRGIVAFTNGEDNNSADEHPTQYEGDGIDTTLEMLTKLEVHGSRTPVFTVGVGKRVDEAKLETLSNDSGGMYASISSYSKLRDELLTSAERVWGARLVCIAGQHSSVRVHVEAETELGSVTDSVKIDF